MIPVLSEEPFLLSILMLLQRRAHLNTYAAFDTRHCHTDSHPNIEQTIGGMNVMMSRLQLRTDSHLVFAGTTIVDLIINTNKTP